LLKDLKIIFENWIWKSNLEKEEILSSLSPSNSAHWPWQPRQPTGLPAGLLTSFPFSPLRFIFRAGPSQLKPLPLPPPCR
jgi:hypothetical protein